MQLERTRRGGTSYSWNIYSEDNSQAAASWYISGVIGRILWKDEQDHVPINVAN